MEGFQSGFALALLQDLLERFRSLVLDEAGQSVQFDTEHELKRLETKLLKAQTLLDGVQLTPNKVSQYWVRDVTRICYDAEDLVDDLLHGSGKTSVLQKVLSYVTNWTMARKIRELEDRLEDILSGLDMLTKTRQQSEWCSVGYDDDLCGKEPDQLVMQKKLFGRDQDKESIIRMLLEETICSVSIVGMDGLGKTTLARNVRSDSRIHANFDHIVWVSVSGTFDLKKVAAFILHRRQKGELKFVPAQFHTSIFQELHLGRSILIVLDDLWDVKYNDWEMFHTLFLRSPNCKVLLTTRNPKVASVTKASLYYLQRMRDEDCRALIMDRALSVNHVTERELVNLEEIAAVIAEKCKGLPLAANTLGLLLSSKHGDVDWTTLSERDICDLQVFREEIFPAFRVNEPDLASHLKKCLAYCSLFPYNYDFKKENMVQLWMAEGFILSQGITSLKEIGNEYFDELLGRSICRHSNFDDDEVPSYKIHEFIHRFAQLVASDTCFRLEECECSVPNWCKKARHLSLLCHSVQPLFLKDIEKCGGLRTFLVLCEHGAKIGQVPYSLFQKLQRLRVLDLGQTDVDKLPESIGRLKHLRYLDVSRTHIQRLPESASDLHGLQVLRLRDCYELVELPKNIKSLTNLLHLDVNITGLRCMPANIGNLTCLQTLHAFIAGRKEGSRVTELKNLKFLRGSLCISGLENVRDGAEAKEVMLCDKPFIKRLELEWRCYSKDGLIAMDVLNGLQPHKNLQVLRVSNYGGLNFPDWLTSPSCMLVSVHLQNCVQHDVLPPLGHLPYLKTLHIEGMHGVNCVDYHFCAEGTNGGFPSLESLKIQDMNSLTKWYQLPDNCMHQLHDVIIEDCPELVSVSSLSHMRTLLTLEVNRCPSLKSLPELPSSVQSLVIVESDLVTQRCQPDGPDWCFIEVIPHVEIDFTEILGSEGSS